MSAVIQSFISDFLHRRNMLDSDGFALKAANSVASVGKWNEESIARALNQTKTELFLRNPNVRKTELMTDLARRILTHCNVSSVDDSEKSCDVLFLAANPSDTGRLAIDEEIRDITEKIRKYKHRDLVKLSSAWAVRPDDLLQTLNEQEPEILHFSGHGTGTSGLVLSNDKGQAKLVSTRALDSLFRTFKGKIQVIVLNACYSVEQGTTINKHVDCVIAMKDSISDEAAKTFAASFYRAIGFGHSVHQAFQQARTALLLESIDEDNIPILLVHKGVDPNKIILVKPDTLS